MRGTAPILAVVIAIAIAATVDALRGGGREAGSEPTTTQRARAAPTPEEDLRAAGVSGTLSFTLKIDEGCVLHTLRLPDLQDAGSFVLDSCRFDVSSGGEVVSGGACPSRVVEVLSAETGRIRGCAPAWKPDGRVTFMRDGDVRTAEDEVLVGDVTRFARRALGGVGRLSVRQIGWLNDTTLAALVGGSDDFDDVIVIIENGRRVGGPIFVAAGATFFVKRNGREIFVGGRGFGIQVYDRRGLFVSEGGAFFPDVGALAESPDGRWIALARPRNICIYEQTDPPPREDFPLACLPFDAVDLGWSY